MMARIAPDSLLSLEAYARERNAYRSRVIAHKQLRTLHVGEHLTLIFEDELTIRYQIQEMLRIERTFEEAGIQGELTLDFVIARSGKVDSIELVRGSGSKILDDEAIRSIRKAAPFDPIPAQYKIPSLLIRGRFVYVHGGALRLR